MKVKNHNIDVHTTRYIQDLYDMHTSFGHRLTETLTEVNEINYPSYTCSCGVIFIRPTEDAESSSMS
jgi:hypothetical protein